jgi:hypothetical protein
MRTLELLALPLVAVALVAWPCAVNRGFIARQAWLTAAAGGLLVAAGAATAASTSESAYNALLALLVWARAALLTIPYPTYRRRVALALVRAAPVVFWVSAVFVALRAFDMRVAGDGQRLLSMALTVAGWHAVTMLVLPRQVCRGRKCGKRGDLRRESRAAKQTYFCRGCWRYSCGDCLHWDRFRCYCAACDSARVIERMGRAGRPTLFTPANGWSSSRLNEDFVRAVTGRL